MQITVRWEEQMVWRDDQGRLWRWETPRLHGGSGSGWLVQWKDDSRFIVTNYHVIDSFYTDMDERPADTWDTGHWRVRHSWRVEVSNRQDTVGSKVLRGNETADLAVLSARGVSIEGDPLLLADPDSIAVGDPVAMFGYGTVAEADRYDRIVSGVRYADMEVGKIYEIGSFDDSCHECTVSDSTKKLLISAGAVQGDSGGPVSNASAAIVGVLYAANEDSAVAVHVSHIADEVHRAWLDSFASD